MACIPGASVYLLDRLRYFIVVAMRLLNYHYQLACSRKSFWVGDTPIILRVNTPLMTELILPFICSMYKKHVLLSGVIIFFNLML